MIVETGWPAECPDMTYPPDTTDIPISAEGQTQWINTIVSRVSHVP